MSTEGNSKYTSDYTWNKTLLDYLVEKLSRGHLALLPNTNENNVRDNILDLTLADEDFPEDLMPKLVNPLPPFMEPQGIYPPWVHKIAPIVLELLTEKACKGWNQGFRLHQKIPDGPITHISPDPECTHFGLTLAGLGLDWSLMGKTISQFLSLEGLSLWDSNLSSNNIALFLRAMDSSTTCPMLRDLNLKCNNLSSPGVTVALASFLRSRPNLERLDLEETCLGDDGTLAISNALNHTNLELLNLRNNNIGDTGLKGLLRTKNASRIEILYLDDNKFSQKGVSSQIATFLGKNNTTIRNLSINCDNKSAKTLLGSISRESKLERIGSHLVSSNDTSMPLSGARREEYLDSIAFHLTRLICDRTSFESLCQSNHNLWDIGINLGTNPTENIWKGHETLRESLAINKRLVEGESVANRLRSKLRKLYFQGDFNIGPILALNVKFMPNVLEIVTRDEISCEHGGSCFNRCTNRSWHTICFRDTIDGIYRIVRNCHLPAMFTFPSTDLVVQQLNEEIIQLKREKDETYRADPKLTNKKTSGENCNTHNEISVMDCTLSSTIHPSCYNNVLNSVESFSDRETSNKATCKKRKK